MSRLTSDSVPPLLFRDIGPVAMAAYLRGQLARLSGPTVPLLYLRTAAYREPYTDYEPVGRLAFLDPGALGAWDSGAPEVIVASVRHPVDGTAVAFLPAEHPPEAAIGLLAGVRDRASLREVLGGRHYDESMFANLAALDAVNREADASEAVASPVRRRLQSGSANDRSMIRAFLDRQGVTEHDLCAAYHHVPRERRAHLAEVLRHVPGPT